MVPIETIYLAGGCLWGVQAFVKTLPGVLLTEAGRANGTTDTLDGEYDGYAECVKTTFDPDVVTVEKLMHYLFEIIGPYSINQQGIDVGEKYRTGVYSEESRHLVEAQVFIDRRSDAERIAVEVKQALADLQLYFDQLNDQPAARDVLTADEYDAYIEVLMREESIRVRAGDYGH